MLSLTLGSMIPGRDHWRLRVLGKGDKVRTVPLPLPVANAVLAYLASVGLSYDHVVQTAAAGPSAAGAMAPLLRGRKGRRREGGPAAVEPLHYTRLYNQLKDHLRSCADEIARSDPAAAATFRKASVHWLRHTCATHALNNGVPLKVVQQLLGHASIGTTQGYLNQGRNEMQDAMEAYAEKILG